MEESNRKQFPLSKTKKLQWVVTSQSINEREVREFCASWLAFLSYDCLYNIPPPSTPARIHSLSLLLFFRVFFVARSFNPWPFQFPFFYNYISAFLYSYMFKLLYYMFYKNYKLTITEIFFLLKYNIIVLHFRIKHHVFC